MKRPLLLVLLGATLTIAAEARPSDLTVAFRRGGAVESRPVGAELARVAVPLGSLWKLFVHAYLVESSTPAPTYRCAASPAADDEYCCDPGGSIERDAALAKSCGAFFDPVRLRITREDWQRFWSPRATGEAAWLAQLENLRPERHLSVAAILAALAAVPDGARRVAGRSLLPVMIDGFGQGAVAELGGLVRLKTFTFDHPTRPGARLGGGAGWLVDGTPVWIGRSGASRNVLREDAAAIAAALPLPTDEVFGETCVAVDFFARYPLADIERMPERAAASDGPLDGEYRLTFRNGNRLRIRSHGDLLLRSDAKGPRIVGQFPLTEYVARVLDREADPNQVEAARALAVVARSWVMENGTLDAGCLRVADDTRAQRVSPRPPTPAALAAARFAEGLVLRGTPVRYRLDRGEPGVLSWKDAVRQARDGASWSALLARAFPGSRLAADTGEEDCRPLPEAQRWLAARLADWRRRLAAEEGFEPPDAPLTLCALSGSVPYSDAQRLRVYVHGAGGREDWIAMAHEYLHLAFRFHPRGGDENWIESKARELVEGVGHAG